MTLEKKKKKDFPGLLWFGAFLLLFFSWGFWGYFSVVVVVVFFLC